MNKLVTILISILVVVSGCVQQQETKKSELDFNGLNITWLGHSSFEIKGNSTIYFDPFILTDKADMADYIMISHDHYDHCNPEQVNKIQNNSTRIISTMKCIGKLNGKTNSIIPGESINYSFNNIYVEAFPANTFDIYHPPGEGVGFYVEDQGTKLYFAGDTDNIPEFSNLTEKHIDILFLPIGGKYTMNVTEAAEAARITNPKILVPMHYNSGKYGIKDIDADPQQLKTLLKESGITVEILQPAA